MDLSVQKCSGVFPGVVFVPLAWHLVTRDSGRWQAEKRGCFREQPSEKWP